ncbi:MAG: hypothetical protein IPI78_00920 [Chitinophagaceae bacterium]|nr:hypothetical protein [Chitinophagaceae bacterium]
MLTYPGIDGKSVKDSSAINNGKFEFKGNLTGPVMAKPVWKHSIEVFGDPDYTNFSSSQKYYNQCRKKRNLRLQNSLAQNCRKNINP